MEVFEKNAVRSVPGPAELLDPHQVVSHIQQVLEGKLQVHDNELSFNPVLFKGHVGRAPPVFPYPFNTLLTITQNLSLLMGASKN